MTPGTECGSAGIERDTQTIGDATEIGRPCRHRRLLALKCEGLSFGFQGAGQPHTVRIQLKGTADTSVAKGATIGVLNAIEILPRSIAVVYGFVNGEIRFPAFIVPAVGSLAGKSGANRR